VINTIMKKKFWLASPLACLVTLLLCFAGTSSALAATFTHLSPPPAPPPNPCLYEGAGIQNDGPNEILLWGSTYSVCGTTGIVTNVTQQIRVTNGCEGTLGTGPSTLYNSFNIRWQNSAQADYTDRVGCVVCHYTNHHLTGETYPNFTMFVTVSASGSYKQGGRTIPAIDTGSVQVSFTVTNYGLYAPSCPPTH
jgi:hypothetical protein